VGRTFLTQSAQDSEVFRFYLWRPNDNQVWTTQFTLESVVGGQYGAGTFPAMEFTIPIPSVHGKVTLGADESAISDVQMIVYGSTPQYNGSQYTSLVTNSLGEYCLPGITEGTSLSFGPVHPYYTFDPPLFNLVLVSTVVEYNFIATALKDTDATTVLSQYQLHTNYPNPFNPSTTISFDVAREGRVSIEVYNSKGQRVCVLVDGVYGAGVHNVVWNGVSDDGYAVGSGVYFYRMSAGEYVSVRKMLLMK